MAGLRSIYRPGFNMAKAGVMLMQLQPDTVQQQELALDIDDQQQHSQTGPGKHESEVRERSRLMVAMEGINDRYGRNALILASAGLAAARRA